jgi:hypothetical protein
MGSERDELRELVGQRGQIERPGRFRQGTPTPG